ncbi:non-ribosomal peptide synthetase [Virgibacillus proomii]|uniref:non-ribosomal peptide synthetase n=1 Tax=Virgibacillus proomii TaxID=84407 RepID=UPI001C12613A|nr:non-ribosomal peptide synthetase [Virgibacillus proomii]MBU5265921.1 amino acid adenylation domain-containing protein [Virgibacillus proomii]
MKENYYSLTHPQRRIWTVEKVYPATSLHNIVGASLLTGEVDFSVLEKSIQLFIQNNDGIRIRLIEKSGTCFQFVKPYEDEKITFQDFSENDFEYNQWANSEAKIPIDIYENKLYTFTLVKTTSKQGFFFKFHHIITDGWSTSSMVDRIWEVYLKIKNGEDYEVKSTNSYLEYIKKEEEYLSSTRFNKDRDFWLEKLKDVDILPKHSFSTNLEGDRKTFILERDLTEQIIKLVKERKCSISSLFIAIIIIYLHKFYQKEDITIGTPVFNRSGKKQKNIFGMFTSTIPFRSDIDPKESRINFIDRVHKELFKCYLHQRYPYNILLNDLGFDKVGLDGLFNISVNYYNKEILKKIDGDLVELFEYYSGCQQDSLQIVIKDWQEDGRLSLDFDYKTDDYSSEEIDYIFNRINFLMKQLTSRPLHKISELEILPPHEKQSLISNNTSKLSVPEDLTVVELFENQVKKTPNNISLEYNGKYLTYKELNQKANYLAKLLRGKGIGRNNLIGIKVQHSIDMIIGIWGILKSGSAYLPIDPDTPNERVHYMIHNSNTTLLLTDEYNFIHENIEILYLPNILNEEVSLEFETNLPLINEPNDMVYTIYTSGSTGNPKGAMINNVNLLNYICWAKNTYINHQDESFGCFTSLAFDLTVTSIFVPLINGNKIIIYNEYNYDEFILDIILKENKVDILKLTPAHLSAIQHIKKSKSKLKRLIVGGDDIKERLARTISNNFDNQITIYNEYGPTEATVGCMIYKYNQEENQGSVPIGKPISNVTIYVLNNDRELVPHGAIGEIYISGKGLSSGYISNERLTNSSFIPHPLIKGERLYRTGDLGKVLLDGNIIYMGRIDSQVKINGYRIEIKEIESLMMRHEGIEDAYIVTRTNTKGNKILYAYYKSPINLEENRVRSYLLEYLPLYMMPHQIIRVDTIPLTRNGKINKDALPLTSKNVDREHNNSIMNGTTLEVIEVLQEILNQNSITLEDNFFHLGGDSIKAIQISTKLNNVGIRLNVKNIMSTPRIRDLIEKTTLIKRKHTLMKPVEGEIGNTPIAAWFFRQNFSVIHHWNQSLVLKFNSKVNIEKLQLTFNHLIRHHDGLRINVDLSRKQMFYNQEHLKMEHEILFYQLDSFTKEEALHHMNYIGEKVKSSFDLEKDLLIRAVYFSMGDRHEDYLLITAHHLVIDGVSWRILLEDLVTVYQSLINNAEIELPPKTDSIKEWSRVLENKQKEFYASQNYWDDMLTSIKKLPLIDMVKLHTNEEVKISNEKEYLNKDDTALLMGVANKAFGTKTNELLICALARTLNEYTGDNKILIELEGHGREDLFDEVDVSRTVGWFTAMYPILLEFNQLELNSQIKSVKDQIRNVPNNGLDYGVLTQLSNVIDDKTKNKLVRFNYLGDFSQARNNFFTIATDVIGEDISKANHMTCLMDITVMIINEVMEIKIQYSKGLFSSKFIQGFLSTYINAIKTVMDYCANNKEIEFTPTDFDTISLSQIELDRLFK